MLTLETIQKDSIWVAKMQGWRTSGTRAEIGHLYHSEECRDFDLCCEQPDHLKEFYDAYWKYDEEHGFTTIQDFYNNVYSKQPERKVWTADEIKELVQTNDKVLYRALKRLYDCQTADEQTSRSTSHKNGAGFNSIDAEFLTSVAEFMLRTGYLTNKQKAVVRKKLVKYTGQLTRIANAS